MRPLGALVRAIIAFLSGPSSGPGRRHGDANAPGPAVRAPETAYTIELGDLIGPYRVISKLANGGYVAVHDARSSRVHIEVAPRHERPLDAAVRMLETARLVDRIRHPAVAGVVGRGLLADRRPWIAVEAPGGVELHDVIARRALSVPDVVGLVHHVAEVLVRAHECGVVHRALTARSVLLDGDDWRARDYLCVTDWGKAADDSSIYSAPEGSTGNASVDVFALGMIAYRAATQQFPPPHLAEVPRVPASLAGLIVSMLVVDPSARPTAADVYAMTAELLVGATATVSEAMAAAPGLMLADRVRPGARFAKPKWTPAPVITSEQAPFVVGEIASKTEKN